MDNSTHNCSYSEAEFLTERFGLVTVFGTLMSLFGIANNTILLVLLTRGSLLSNLFFLAVLAGCDIVVEISYMLLMSAQILYDYAQSLPLYLAWNAYLCPVFTVSHVSMTVSTYMIVAGSAERYLAASRWSTSERGCTPRGRLWTIVFILAWSVLAKGMVFWEIDVVSHENCSGFELHSVHPSELAENPYYRFYYMLWFRNFVHVFLPFVLLIVLNAAILINHSQRYYNRWLQPQVVVNDVDAVDQRHKVRAAGRMLAAIVITYLISNVLNVIISLMEYVDIGYLRRQVKFYAFATDTINLLTVFTSAIRLPIYCVCNRQLREDLRRLFRDKLKTRYWLAPNGHKHVTV